MTTVVKPMLASESTEPIKYPIMASPKLDGIRCLIVEGVVMSRSMKPIRNAHIQKMLGKVKYSGLDGELIVGSPTAHNVYRITNSGVMSTDGVPDFKFYVFDKFDDTDMAIRRYNRLCGAKRLPKFIEIVPHATISNEAELTEYESKCLSDGYEGIMVKDPKGFYKHGRATAKGGELLKIKRFVDDEAEIIDIYELMHNDNPAEKDAFGRIERSTAKDNLRPAGVAGGITARRPDGSVFSIGTGYDADTRDWLWTNKFSLIGKLVKYKHFPLGNYDVPRFPVFLGIRDADDTGG